MGKYSLSDLFLVLTCFGVLLGVLMMVPWKGVAEVFAISRLGWGMIAVFLSFVIGGAVLWWIRFGRG